MMKEREPIGLVLDSMALILIGLGCFAYAQFTRVFAQLHLTMPFMNFPIFIGEFLLGSGLILFFIKYRTAGLKLSFQRNKKTVLVLFFFGAFILVKAGYGYVHHGPLALRNAALFYYPFFALLTYEFYNQHFFNRKTILFLCFLLTGIVTIRQLNSYYYFMFTYFLLALFLILKLPAKKLKTMLFLALVIFTPYQLCFAYSRASVIGLIASIMVLSMLFVHRSRRLNRVFQVSLAIFVLAAGVTMAYVFSNKSKAEAFLHLNEITGSLKEIDRFAEEQKGRTAQKPIAVKLYTEDKGIEYSQSRKVISSDLPLVVANFRPRERISEQSTVPGKSRFPRRSEVGPGQERKAMPESGSAQGIRVIEADGSGSAIQESTPALDTETPSLNNILWRILVFRDMFREFLKSNWFTGIDFGKPFRSPTIELLRWNRLEIEQVGWLEPHNSYLHILYRAGLIGLALIGFFMILTIQTARKFLKEDRYGLILIAILVYWMTVANFMVLFELPFFAIPFWSLFGIAIAYAHSPGRVAR